MSGRMCYDYPIRPHFKAQVMIPHDMTKQEAERLCAFVMALARPSPTAAVNTEGEKDV